MRHYVGLVTVGLVVGLGSSSFGQMGGFGGDFGQFGNAGAETGNAKAVAVAMDTTDGKTTAGELKLTAAVVACSLGIYEIKSDKIQAIRFDPLTKDQHGLTDRAGTQRLGAIVTLTGEVIEGTILIPNWWRIQTDLGVLTPNSEKIKSITFTHSEGPQSLPADPAPDRLELRPIPASTRSTRSTGESVSAPESIVPNPGPAESRPAPGSIVPVPAPETA